MIFLSQVHDLWHGCTPLKGVVRAMPARQRRNGNLAQRIVTNYSNGLRGLSQLRGDRAKPCQASCQGCGKKAVPSIMPRIDLPKTPRRRSLL